MCKSFIYKLKFSTHQFPLIVSSYVYSLRISISYTISLSLIYSTIDNTMALCVCMCFEFEITSHTHTHSTVHIMSLLIRSNKSDVWKVSTKARYGCDGDVVWCGMMAERNVKITQNYTNIYMMSKIDTQQRYTAIEEIHTSLTDTHTHTHSHCRTSFDCFSTVCLLHMFIILTFNWQLKFKLILPLPREL